MRKIYHRKDGRYEGRIADTLEDGSKKYISVYGRTAEEAEAKLNAIKADKQALFNSRTGGSNQQLTIRTLFYDWLDIAAIRVKESSLANYRMKIEKHIIPKLGDLHCCELTSEMVQSFISEKLKCGLSPKYVSDIVILMKSIFRHASRTRGLQNPLEYVELPKRKSTEVQLLSRNQQKTLQTYLLNNMSLSSLGILLCFYTGLRIGELCALKWEDIDFENGIINVSRTIQRIQKSGRNGIKCGTKLIITEPKSSSSIRRIPIPEVILPYLLKYKSEAEFFVLSGSIKPVEPRVMQYRFAVILKKADLSSVHFHALRHMFASNCIACGFDVKSLSEILGHSSVDITLNRYVHSSMEQKRKFMSKLNFAAYDFNRFLDEWIIETISNYSIRQIDLKSEQDIQTITESFDVFYSGLPYRFKREWIPISTLVSFGLLFTYRYLSVNKFFKINISVKKLIPQLMIYVIAWISYLIRNNAFVIIGLTINVVFIIRLIIKNKDRVLCAVNSFRNATGKRED